MSAVTTTTVSIETLRIRSGLSSIDALIRRPLAEHAPATPCLTLICDPLPLAGDASDDLTEAITDGLLDAGISVATYESQSRQLILDDYDAYDAPQSLGELISVWDAVSTAGPHAELPNCRYVLLGIGIGATITLAALHRIQAVHDVGLVNPATVQSITVAQSRKSSRSDNTAAIPAAFTETISEFDITFSANRDKSAMLCLAGAADRLVPASSAQTIAATARAAGWTAQSLLLAGGDHALTDPQIRALAIQNLARFCATDHRD